MLQGTLCDTDNEMVRSIELFLLKFEFFISSKKAQTAARNIVMNTEIQPNLFCIMLINGIGLHLYIKSFKLI